MNGSGHLVDRDKDMRCFDLLAPRVREVLRTTTFDVGSQQVRSSYNRIGINATIEAIRKIDADHVRKTRVSAWGDGYPRRE